MRVGGLAARGKSWWQCSMAPTGAMLSPAPASRHPRAPALRSAPQLLKQVRRDLYSTDRPSTDPQSVDRPNSDPQSVDGPVKDVSELPLSSIGKFEVG